MYKSVIALALTAFLYQGNAFAYDLDFFGVTTLATVSVGPNLKRYSIKVKNCANNLAQLKLSIAQTGVEIHGLGINYTDGYKDDYGISSTFAAGYESAWIDVDNLKSAGHCVSQVYVNANTVPGATKNAIVTIYGNAK